MSEHLSGPLLGTHNLRRQAQIAWKNLSEWRISLSELTREARSPDECAFAEAAQSYSKLLLKGRWIDSEQLVVEVIRHLSAGGLSLPEELVYAGFDRVSPRAAELFAALEKAGCRVLAVERPGFKTTLTTSSYADVDAELRAAGSWARARLFENPEARVGIVAPDLATESDRFAGLIREGLVPGWQRENTACERAVNVSFGRSLSDYPAIRIALLCLHWIHDGLPSRDVSILLRSPFLGAVDIAGRCELELYLRQLPDRKWTAAALAEALADETSNSHAMAWLEQVRRIASLQTMAMEKNSPVTWARHLDELLNEIGWPGEGSLRSPEFQLINRWRNLLNELASLDVVIPSMTFADAAGHLASLAREVVYQPDTGAGLVNLLGSLEAAGMEFTDLWVVGMDASRWPSSGQPMPLVSRNLQRRHGMPDASPQDSLEYSRRVLKRLASSAEAVHFSWSRVEQDTPQLPTSLLDELSPLVEHEFGDPYWYADSLRGAARVHEIKADVAPPVKKIEKIAGGAYTIQRQTIEPFAAFAYGRLGVRDLRHFEVGLSPSLRGILLHETLHELLRQKPAQQDIASWSEAEKEKRIFAAIENGFAATLRHADAVLRRLLAIERRRLRGVIDRFLAMEQMRSNFSIEQVEERIEFTFAGIQVALRADRIDRLADDTLLVIDYKTGQVKNFLGRDKSPVDLQLVVYATALDQEVGGLALFNVGTRTIAHKGVGGSVEWNTVEKTEWQEMLSRWSLSVHAAMEQIAAGDVRINLRLNTDQSRLLNVLSRAEELKRAR
jgi:probable DNA repair protein